MNKTHKRADQYDNGDFNYLDYWRGRDYENIAEEIAIKRLLKDRRFKHAADIGGGYGRLCLLLEKYANTVILAEPSENQLKIAKDFLKGHSKINVMKTQADSLDLKDKSVDLITMIRVMHHLPDPSAELKELYRILTDDGYLILEMANYSHMRNRVKYFFTNKTLPNEPVDIRSKNNQRKDEVAFVNHNPKTVIKQLAHAGFKVEKVLSVSNLRSPLLKKIVPKIIMTTAERLMQQPLAKIYFGPSIFLLAKKAK